MHLERAIRWACLLEVAARKPGNVHPQASFDDLRYEDFVRSAEVVAPILARSEEIGVGQAVLDAVIATRAVANTNTNLGMLLLIAPLAAVPRSQRLTDGIAGVLAATSVADAEKVYEAIRLANPGGIGQVGEQDIKNVPTETLRKVMTRAAQHDLIAEQYATDFKIVLTFGMKRLADEQEFASQWERSIVQLQLELMSRWPDTLIARKRGWSEADESAQRAESVLKAGSLDSAEGQNRLAEFDAWLRADGHLRNPGTTADLVAASLFAAFREEAIVPPEFLEE